MSSLSGRKHLHENYADNSFSIDLLNMIDCPKELARINEHHAQGDLNHEPITQNEMNGILVRALTLRLSAVERRDYG